MRTYKNIKDNNGEYAFTPREVKVMELRDEGYTLEETGQEFGVTRERIRQIEAKVLEKYKALMQ